VFETYLEEAQFALHAARSAATLCRQIQVELVSPAITKADRSPVTVADFASQALVGNMLSRAFPQDRLVAEEDSRTLQAEDDDTTLERVTEYIGRLLPEVDQQKVCTWIDLGAGEPLGRFWILDPIDGTKGFLRGDQYVTALALVEDGEVVVGALGCPNLNRGMTPDLGGEGSAVLAVKGMGCYSYGMKSDDPIQLFVSDQVNPEAARLLRSYESGHTHEGKMSELVEVLGTQADPVRMDSQAKYAVMAAGGGDLLFRLISPEKPDYEEMIWDQAAGALVVEEAGGRVTDLQGRSLDFTRGRNLRANIGVLASNGKLHDVALDALQRVGADQRPGRA
jgi:3'(2'), 5'-bisphosphate nucleotidase